MVQTSWNNLVVATFLTTAGGVGLVQSIFS